MVVNSWMIFNEKLSLYSWKKSRGFDETSLREYHCEDIKEKRNSWWLLVLNTKANGTKILIITNGSSNAAYKF